MPDKSMDDIREHFEWHLRYLAYMARKKELLVEWKQAKEIAQEEEELEEAKERQATEAVHRAQEEKRKEHQEEQRQAVNQWRVRMKLWSRTITRGD